MVWSCTNVNSSQMRTEMLFCSCKLKPILFCTNHMDCLLFLDWCSHLSLFHIVDILGRNFSILPQFGHFQSILVWLLALENAFQRANSKPQSWSNWIEFSRWKSQVIVLCSAKAQRTSNSLIRSSCWFVSMRAPGRMSPLSQLLESLLHHWRYSWNVS